eukprot:CAMPEP_0196579308 /NCGR_PEP_ID=MMETSP1081-20130531/19859_1 /TAXON_ID=36882 /ORGANISM="Pyramimonas amylifera, Strain CCMP720" /LENGTH=140 /DNA_ID=CAMNT_0041898843 /DNA_START=99 /DNA_END=521 /DNA_ORIENTATION=-
MSAIFSSSMMGRSLTLNGPQASRNAARASSSRVVCQASPAIQNIRIKLRSYKVPELIESCEKICAAAAASNATAVGPIALPTRRKIFCVLRSPHVNKDSREHFEIRTHQRLIDLKNPSAQTIDSLMQIDLPAGVDIEVKL